MKKKILSIVIAVMMMGQVLSPVMAMEINVMGQNDSENASQDASDTFVRPGIYTNEVPTSPPSGSGNEIMVGTTLGIEKLDNGNIWIKVIHCARTAIAETEVCETAVKENKAVFDWEDLNYGSSGTGEIIFNENNVVITMDTIVGGRFSFNLDHEILEPDDETTMGDYINEDFEALKGK